MSGASSILFGGGLLALVAVGQASGAVVDPAARSAATAGWVDVIVGLHIAAPANASVATIASVQSAVTGAIPYECMQVKHRYQTVPAIAVRVDARGLEALARDPDVAWIGRDLEGGGALSESVPQISADRVRKRQVDADGIVVAVVDSGVDAAHPDIVGSVIHEECFCNGNCDEGGGIACRPDCCPDGSARQSGPGSADAGHPHGTNVTGILLSRGNLAEIGVAPAADVIAIRVLDSGNRGRVSDWLAALDWIAARRPDVRVVNMSLASSMLFQADCAADCELDCRPQDGCNPDTVCAINRMIADVVDRLRSRGTVVVAASGNSSDETAMASPACVDGVMAVGAVDELDRVAFFSNASPQLDVLAPGTNVVAPLPDSGVGQFCSNVAGRPVCGGTSMAAPHVAGAAALLMAADPTATADRIEDAIRGSGIAVRDPRNGRVYPRLDAWNAFREITGVREVIGGGGSGTHDCILEWNFFPPDIVRQRRNPIATCVDGDPVCDGDGTTGQCTFLFSLCFSFTDPLLPMCSNDRPIADIELREPRPDAAPGSVERENADAILAVLPPFPIEGDNLCSQLIPFTVTRSGDQGIAYLHLRARTDQRTDADRFVLRCIAP